MSKAVTVHPVEGRFLMGVPTVPTILPPDEAEKLVATGAFTYDPPAVADEPIAADDPADEPEV